jgi:2-dehydropantoate 2-reductase
VLARHRTLETLARDGIALVDGALANGPKSGAPAGHDAEQLAEPGQRRRHRRPRPDAFRLPGVGGYRRDDGAISYIEIPQQPTTLGRQQGREDIAGAAFRSAGFAVDTTADMDGWLKTHAVFIAAMCASINSCGGDAVKLAADRARVATMISSAGEGFRALTSQGVAVQPRPPKMICTMVPRVFAVRYWQRQLRGTVGTVALAPHSRMTKDTELPVLYRDVQKMVAGMVPTPHLDTLLSLAQRNPQ